MTTLPRLRQGCEQGGLSGGQDALLKRLQLCWEQQEQAADEAVRTKRPRCEEEALSGQELSHGGFSIFDGHGTSGPMHSGSAEVSGGEEVRVHDDDGYDTDAEVISSHLRDMDMAQFTVEQAVNLVRALGNDTAAAAGGTVRAFERSIFVRDLRYTSDRLPARFCDGRRLDDLVADLRQGRIIASSAPCLRLDAVRFRGRSYCLNNRRLWCLREYQRQVPHDVRIQVRIYELGPVGRRFVPARPGQASRSSVLQLSSVRLPSTLRAPPAPPMPELPPAPPMPDLR